MGKAKNLGIVLQKHRIVIATEKTRRNIVIACQRRRWSCSGTVTSTFRLDAMTKSASDRTETLAIRL